MRFLLQERDQQRNEQIEDSRDQRRGEGERVSIHTSLSSVKQWSEFSMSWWMERVAL